MSLAHDLESLRQQRDQEIHTLHLTYLRTKRTLVRTASPSRLIRQHMTPSLLIAAALGLLIAPSPAPRTPASPSSSHAGPLRWIKSLLHKFSPQTANMIPDSLTQQPDPSPASTPAKKHTLLKTLLTEGTAFALSQIDLKKFLPLITHYLQNLICPNPANSEHQNHSQNPDGHPDSHPNITPSNANTVPPTNLEDFQ